MRDNRWDLAVAKGFGEVPVILTDMSSLPLKWTRTHSNGSFSFSGIPYGSYKVYADLTGMYSLPETVILSEEIPFTDSLYIEMSPEPLLGISEPEPPVFDILSLYPNPAKDLIRLDIKAEESNTVNLMVYNQLGQQLINESHLLFTGNNKLDINISGLPEGTYLIRMQAVNHTPLLKMFIKTN
jgi:hypothetical protein